MRLKELRLERNLLQKEIANVLGIDRTTYAKYETGASEPNQEMLISLSKFFGVSTDYLLELTNRKEVPLTKADEKLDRNVIFISGRDGSRYEYEVSDGQKDLVKQVLDNFISAENGRI